MLDRLCTKVSSAVICCSAKSCAAAESCEQWILLNDTGVDRRSNDDTVSVLLSVLSTAPCPIHFIFNLFVGFVMVYGDSSCIQGWFVVYYWYDNILCKEQNLMV